MKIAVGCDHIGFSLKGKVVEHLLSMGHEVRDCGTDSQERCDYPLYGYRVARQVVSGDCECGVLICGTGVGISIAAGKVPGIRAAVCSEAYSAFMAKNHNNANIIAFGSRVVGEGVALQILDAYLGTEYEGGRHQKRLDMIAALERGKDLA